MNKVIADVLDSLPQPNHFLEGPEPRRLNRAPRRMMRTPVEKYVVEKSTIFGSVRLHTRRYRTTRPKRLTNTSDSKEDEESVNWLTIRPAPWIVAAGLKYGINMTFWQTSTSWKHNLQTFRPVSNDAEIFMNIRWDDEETVWELINEGKASIWDMNEVGRTPLMVSLTNLSLICDG
jgi:hypothetical protein